MVCRAERDRLRATGGQKTALKKSSQGLTSALTATLQSPRSDTAATRTADLRLRPGLLEAEPVELSVGSLVGEYLLEALAGEGGMGAVWRASRGGRTYAIKTLRAGRSRDGSALERELRLLQKINRADFFPTVHEHRQIGEQLFVVMDFVEGSTLHDYVQQALSRQMRAIDAGAFEQLMTKIIDRLSYLHTWPGGGILFRDLKPKNVMIEPNFGVKLVDFGISHLADPEGAARVLAGSRGYLAPEVLEQGLASVRTDLFSLGRVGLFLLFGHERFDELTPFSMPPLYGERGFGSEIVSVMLSLCAQSPSARPDGCAEALSAVHRALHRAAQRPREGPTGAPCAVCGRARPARVSFCPWCGARLSELPPDPSARRPAVAPLGPLVRGEARLLDAYRALLEARAASDLTHLRCLAQIRVQPYEYQREAAVAVVAKLGGKALIADDVGLGKTIEAGLVIREQMVRGFVRRVLVVCPPGVLLEQFREEMREKFDLYFEIFSPRRARPLDDLVIVSRGVLSRGSERLRDVQWDLVVVDECHHFTSHTTKQWQNLRRLVAKAKGVLLLSATPFRGEPVQLWSLLSILDPGLVGNDPKEFRKRFLVQERRGDKPRPSFELKQIVERYTIRRRRTDIGGGIPFPGREAVRVAAPLSSEEAELHRQISAAIRAAGENGLVQSGAHRQLASSYESLAQGALMARLAPEIAQALAAKRDREHPKMRVLLSRVLPALPDDEKLLLFTHFQASQRAISEVLREGGIGVIDLNRLPAGERAFAVRRFRDDPKIRVMVCGEGAGEGLNLQFCSILVNFDLPWNPMRIEQRIGRIQRIGQRRKRVSVINLVLAGTIEDRVLEILTDRLALFRLFMGETEQVLGRLIEEDSGSDAFESWVARLVLADGSLDEDAIVALGDRIQAAVREVGQQRQEAYEDANHLIGTPGPSSEIPPPEIPPLDLSFLGED